MNNQNNTLTNRKIKFSFLTKFPIHQLIIIIFTLVAYFNVTSFDLIEFDDKNIIESAKNIDESTLNLIFAKDPYFKSDKASTFYRPVQNATILIDSFLRGNDYSIFHLTNLLIHIITALSLYYLFQNLKYNPLTSLLSTTIFALHPLFTFNVAWIPARGDMLLALFAILTFTFFVKYLEGKKNLSLVISTIFLQLAVFSKESGLLIPLILFSYYLFKKKSNTKNVIPAVICWIFVVAIFFTLKSLLLPNSITSINTNLNELVVNLRYFPEYLSKFFMPINLSGMNQFSDKTIYIGFGFISLLALVLILMRKRLRTANIVISIIWFIIFLLPVIFYKQSYLQTGEYWEHRSYLPLIGLILLLSEIFYQFKVSQRTIVNILAVVSVVFLTLTIKTSPHYSNAFNFFNNIIEKGTTLPNAYFSRGTIYADRGDNYNAMSDFNRAISLKDNYWEAYFKRGIINRKNSNIDAAINDFKKSVHIKTDMEDAYVNLAVCFYSKADYILAKNYLLKAIQINPKDQRAKDMFKSLEKKLQ